jgi:DNA-binding response OmpR family regulator
MRMLVVEDNEELAQLLAKGLGAAGFAADLAARAEDARQMLAANRYCALVLDLGLPDGDGLSVLRDLRARGESIPVLILTARGSVNDRVAGLGAGADDYLVKPFAFEELVARLRALLRRPGAMLGKTLVMGNVTFDVESRQIYISGQPHLFSARETAVLEILLRRGGRVTPKKFVEDHLFGLSGDVGSNAVEVYVHRLRKQLSQAAANLEIHTIRGVGYVLNEAKA